MYPFGFGLGYTDFALGEAAVRVKDGRVTLRIPVENVGGAAGREVVQVYVSAPWGKLDRPLRQLAAFVKTPELAAGERCSVEASFAMQELAGFDEEGCCWLLEQGDYIVCVGNSSRSTKPAAVVRLDETVMVQKVHPAGGTPDFQDWKPEQPDRELPAGVPVLQVDSAALAAAEQPQRWECSEYARGVVSALSDRQLISLSMGLFSKGPGSVIGNASQTVAGAAGETYGRLPGLPGLVMADGPAGLRLNRQYTRDKKGRPHPIGSALPAGMEDYLPGVARAFLNRGGKKPKGEVFEQYCTAIPIGTALAQSWNVEMVKTCGGIVGEEMERFGIHLWLAPAFNIHRNILCGRNFEYYSEDPLLSGKMGAAITLGVQAHPGRGTTVKHFCCNNQERNRMTSNSIVSQRALREIYLRPFQICIQESDPAALMTSYNLLNGVHTSERKDLLCQVLREEWGYRGLVMTDWVVPGMSFKTAHRPAKSAPSIAAGNVYMPGSQSDYNAALNAMHGKNKDFTLSRTEAERCAAQVVELVRRLITQRTQNHEQQ
jgi:beta-glucosidase